VDGVAKGRRGSAPTREHLTTEVQRRPQGEERRPARDPFRPPALLTAPERLWDDWDDPDADEAYAEIPA
jgi:hypothetical protein